MTRRQPDHRSSVFGRFVLGHSARLAHWGLVGLLIAGGALACLAQENPVPKQDQPAQDQPAQDEPAQDRPAQAEAATKVASAADQEPTVADWVEALDAKQFSERQAATKKLLEAGDAAIPALTEAALSESRERSTRALEILKQHYERGSEELKKSAKVALESIAQSGQEPLAGRAKLVLDPPRPADPQAQLRALNANVIQIQVQGFAQGGRQMQVQNVNGVKTTKVKEANRTVEIQEGAGNIRVTVKDGNGEKVYQAKDANELKQKHPEGHKVYEEFSKPGAAGAPPIIQLGAIPGFRLPNAPDKQAADKEAQEELDAAIKLLEEIKSDTADGEKVREALKRLEKVRDKLKS